MGDRDEFDATGAATSFLHEFPCPSTEGGYPPPGRASQEISGASARHDALGVFARSSGDPVAESRGVT
jgi:hypothetical protein